MTPYVYAVVDDKDRIIKIYTSYKWARRKAETSESYRIVSYITTENRRLLELELYSIKVANKWVE